MKALGWLLLIALVLGGLATPILYFYVASLLPRLESEFDLEKQMKHSVEGERMSQDMGTFQRTPRRKWERPDFSRLPKDFVALYISQQACPTYFQTPREEGWTWTWRSFSGAILNKHPPGDGRCEWYFAMRIAEEIGIHGEGWFHEMSQHMAASKIHGFLQKDQLISYVLAGTVFDRAVVGVDDASQDLYGRSVDDLQLSELAELSLSLPENGYYDDLKECRNPSAIRQQRDAALRQLGGVGMVTRERVETAKNQPLACTKTR